jgi:predicted transcriptional regulator of viral defense system
MESAVIKMFQSTKTVLTIKDLALLWRETDANNLKAKAAYYVKRGVLIRLTRGVFAKSKEYDPKELATSLYAPSYVSFETVLREAGVIFQHYDTIFVAGPWSRINTIDRYTIRSRRLKDEILFNPTGITIGNTYSIATVERAFLDMIYLFPRYYFDNLRPIDWEKCFELVGVYNNKQMVKRIIEYKKRYAE